MSKKLAPEKSQKKLAMLKMSGKSITFLEAYQDIYPDKKTKIGKIRLIITNRSGPKMGKAPNK